MIELGVIETRCFELFTGVGISYVAMTGGYSGTKEYYEGKFPRRSFDLDMERASQYFVERLNKNALKRKPVADSLRQARIEELEDELSSLTGIDYRSVRTRRERRSSKGG